MLSQISEERLANFKAEMHFFDEDLVYRFEERAAIIEFDGGFSRVDAEKMAYILEVLGYSLQNPRVEYAVN